MTDILRSIPDYVPNQRILDDARRMATVPCIDDPVERVVAFIDVLDAEVVEVKSIETQYVMNAQIQYDTHACDQYSFFLIAYDKDVSLTRGDFAPSGGNIVFGRRDDENNYPPNVSFNVIGSIYYDSEVPTSNFYNRNIPPYELLKYPLYFQKPIRLALVVRYTTILVGDGVFFGRISGRALPEKIVSSYFESIEDRANLADDNFVSGEFVRRSKRDKLHPVISSIFETRPGVILNPFAHIFNEEMAGRAIGVFDPVDIFGSGVVEGVGDLVSVGVGKVNR